MSVIQPQITEATRAALSEVASLAFRIWPEAYKDILSEAQIAYMLDKMYHADTLATQFDSGHKFLLISENGVHSGFASFELRPQASAHLHKLYVLTSRQGKGMGKFLLQAAERRVANEGATSMTLNVNRYNPAIGFYRKCGYEIIGRKDIPIGNGFVMEDYVMRKSWRHEDSTIEKGDAVK